MSREQTYWRGHLATFRGEIRTLNSTVSDPSLCLEEEGVAQFCVLWSVVGFPLSVRDQISASGDPRPLKWSDVYVGFPMIRCGASPESRTVVDPWGAHGLRSGQRVVITM